MKSGLLLFFMFVGSVLFAQNYSLSFNGSSFITVPDSPTLNPSSQLTLEVWIKTDQIHTNAGIAGKWGSAPPHTGLEQFVLQAASSNDVNFHTKNGSVQDWVTVFSINDNYWHHIAGVFSGDSLFVYKDGILIQSKAYSGVIPSFNQPFEIGRYAMGIGGSQNYFSGLIDDVRLWNRALSPAEISSNMYSGLSGSESGLLAYWDFNEGSGSVVLDKTTNHNDGTNSGATYSTDAPTIQNLSSIHFDGIDDYIEIPHNSSLDFSQFTVEAWFKWNALKQPPFIISKDDGNFEIHLNSDKWVRFQPTAGSQIDGNINSIDTMIWTHIACVYNPTNNTGKTYINGIETGYQQQTGLNLPIAPNSSPISIGRRTFNSNPVLFFNGNLDEIRIWNYALSQAEIQTNMNNPLTGSETGLAAYWDFNERSGSTIFDKSPNGNNGTIYGATYSTEIPTETPDPSPQISYTNVTSGSGTPNCYTGFFQYIDYNNDNYPDIFVKDPNTYVFSLYKNNGDFTFSDVTNPSGFSLAASNQTGNNSFQVADYNRDGWQDVLAYDYANYKLLFLVNQNGVFSDQSVSYTIPQNFLPASVNVEGFSTAVADFDGNGFLDFAFGKNDASTHKQTVFCLFNSGTSFGSPVELFQNNVAEHKFILQAIDYDLDGDEDLLVLDTDFSIYWSGQYYNHPMKLFKNTAGVFTETTLPGLGTSNQDDFALVWDFNNDGYPDFTSGTPDYVANEASIVKTYRNNGGLSLTDVTSEIQINQGGGQYILFNSALDIDQDGDQDYIGKGSVFLNNLTGAFTHSPSLSTAIQSLWHRTDPVDLDNDGDLDIMTPAESGGIRVIKNNSTGTHYLKIKLMGTQSPKEGQGAFVKVKTGSQTQFRHFYSNRLGVGAFSASAKDIFFGLGENTSVDSVIVYWPSGEISGLANVTANQILTITEPALPIIPSYIPTNGLVAWYPFNGTANDMSGTGNHGTVSGAILTVDRSGNNNSAYSFNGNSDFIEVSDNQSIDFTNQMSFCAWYKPDLPVQETQMILGKGWSFSHTGFYNFGIHQGGPAFGLNDGVQNYAAWYSTPVVDGWHFIVGTYDGTILKIYVDGVKKEEVSATLSLQNSQNTPLSIGREAVDLGRYFAGDIDDIAMWNRPLTQQEITQLYYGDLTPPLTVTDIDGNIYNTTKIGTQIWTTSNLKVTKYNDGTSIPNLTDGGQWVATSTDAYCSYNNDQNNVTTYGYLYNWYAVNTGKLAPEGWHVPSDEEWDMLMTAVGGEETAGTKLKAPTGWNENGNGTDDFSFTALPAGDRSYNGGFFNVGSHGFWWSSSPTDPNDAGYRLMNSNSASMTSLSINKREGFSVRLVKDVVDTTITTAWRMQIKGSISGSQDFENFAGVSVSATNVFDASFDTPEPPANPGNYISVYFPHPEWNNVLGNNFTNDIRTNSDLSDSVSRWYFEVKSNVLNQDVTLNFQNDRIPAGYGRYLTDLQTHQRVNLSVQNTFSYTNTTETPRKYMLVIGDSTSPALSILSPKSGTIWQSGKTKTLNWSGSDGTGIDSVKVYYSEDGTAFNLIASTGNQTTYDWTVPSHTLNHLNKIRVVAIDSVGNQQAITSPFFTISGDSLVTTVSAGWNLLSLPLEPKDSSKSKIVGDDFGSAPYYLWAYSGQAGYQEAQYLYSGSGFWLGALSARSVDVSGAVMEADSLIQPLSLGYNLIGNRFVNSITKSNLFVLSNGVEYSFASAVENNLIGSVLYGFDGTTYQEKDTLSLFKGYWILALSDQLSLIQKVNGGSIPLGKRLAKSSETEESDWSIDVSISSAGKTYQPVTFGTNVMASENFDNSYDNPLPPKSPAPNYVDSFFELSGTYPEMIGNRFKRDITDNLSLSWTLTVETNVSGTYTLSWNSGAAQADPYLVSLTLNNLSSQETVDMLAETEYTTPINGSVQFSIIGVTNSSTVPVELVTFAGANSGNKTILSWQTKSETNNSGWEVERKEMTTGGTSTGSESKTWQKIGFVAGKGTTSEPNSYSFSSPAITRTSLFRLKQIDLDGKYAYSKSIEVEGVKISEFKLYQNYPNPFNPTTVISFNLPKAEKVELKVFDMLGREVKTLINNEAKSEGLHQITFDASNLSNGIYFYQITAGSFKQNKKMLLVK